MTTPHSFKFDDETEGMLRAFCTACNDANMQSVVISGLRAYILKELEENQGIKRRYDELRRSKASEGIRLVHDVEKK